MLQSLRRRLSCLPRAHLVEVRGADRPTLARGNQVLASGATRTATAAAAAAAALQRRVDGRLERTVRHEYGDAASSACTTCKVVKHSTLENTAPTQKGSSPE